MSDSKGSSKFCQAGSGLSLAETSTHVSAWEFSEGVQALISCTPQIAKLSNIYSGIDTIHLSLFVDLEGSIILGEIEAARAIAREYERESVPFTYFSPQWNVHRSGKRHFTYHISMADIHVYFNERSVNGTFPTCIIEIGSLSSHLPGPFAVYNQVLEYFKSSDIIVHKHHITRVDLSTDFVGVALADLDLDRGEHWISRARQFSVHQNNWNLSGISIGKGNLMCRIYDKQLEMREKRAVSKQDFFNRQWGLIVPDKKTPVTRVEFQFRREVLKEFETEDTDGITDLKSLEQNLNSLWSYGSKIWLKHAQDPVDRASNHQSRAKLSPFWYLVQSADFKRENKNIWRQNRKKNYLNVPALIDQGVGCMISAIAATLDSIEDFRTVAGQASHTVFREIQYRLDYKTDEIYEKIRTAFNRNNLNPCGIAA